MPPPPEKKKTAEEATVDRTRADEDERRPTAAAASQQLEKEAWYVGFAGRGTIEDYLKTEGEFVVRASEKTGRTELILAVRSNKAIYNITINYNIVTKKWTIMDGAKAQGFDTIAKLIEHYRNHDIPHDNGKVRLQKVCDRPRWYVFRKDIVYDVKDLLGEGNFCCVYKGRWQKKDVAVKISRDPGGDKELSKEEDRQKIAARQTLLQEGHLMLEVKHPNVIKFYGLCPHQPVVVLMELCPGGSLLSLLLKFGSSICTAERIKFACEAAEGMEYLHSKQIVHRDLAARNCLISRHGTLKIADFGLSQVVSEMVSKSARGEQIPCRWMAPESLYARAEFSPKTDVWSFGVLLFEIFNNGAKLYPDFHNKKVATLIRRGEMPDLPARTPAPVVELVKHKCWVREAKDRATMTPVKVDLKKIQEQHPVRYEELAVNKIPGVRAMHPDWIKQLGGEDEDIVQDVLTTSAMYAAETPAPKNTEDGRVHDRDVTVEEPLPPGAVTPSPPPHHKGRRPHSNKRSRRRSRDRESREISQEVQLATNDECVADENACRKVRKSGRPRPAERPAEQPAQPPTQAVKKPLNSKEK